MWSKQKSLMHQNTLIVSIYYINNYEGQKILCFCGSESLLLHRKSSFRFILECSGVVIFSSFNHKYTLSVNASILHKKRRTKRWIKKRDPDTEKLLPFEVVTMQGTCGWKVWDAKIGGNNYPVQNARMHQPGWQIRRVTLMS